MIQKRGMKTSTPQEFILCSFSNFLIMRLSLLLLLRLFALFLKWKAEVCFGSEAALLIVLKSLQGPAESLQSPSDDSALCK